MEARDIIIRPLITEKSTALMAEGKYVFEVAKAANKIEIAKAVSEIFKVKVEGVNKVKMHVKPNQTNTKGGIIEEEAFFDVSNVMYVVDGKVTRIGFKTEDGKDKVRYAKKTGAVIE